MIEAIQNTMVVQVWLDTIIIYNEMPPQQKKKHGILKENLRKLRLLKLTFQQVCFSLAFLLSGVQGSEAGLVAQQSFHPWRELM